MSNTIKRYILWPIISISIFLLAAELILHLFGVNLHPKGRDFTVNRAPDFPEVFLKDQDLLWRLRPDREITSEFFLGKTYRINRQGFRGQDFKQEKSGLRLAVLGNSCAFGWGVTEAETFACLLQDKIRQAGSAGAEVLNFSVPGYSSFQGKHNYRKSVRAFKPDILLVTFGWNDQWLSACDRADKDQKLPPEPILTIGNHMARFRFYRLLKSVIFSFLSEPEYLHVKSGVYRVSLSDFKANLAEIIDAAEADGARVILLTSPMPSVEIYYATDRPSVLHETHRFYNDITRETAASRSVALVDLAAVFDRHEGLFDDVAADPFHYNARGHALAANEIFRFLKDLDFLIDR